MSEDSFIVTKKFGKVQIKFNQYIKRSYLTCEGIQPILVFPSIYAHQYSFREIALKGEKIVNNSRVQSDVFYYFRQYNQEVSQKNKVMIFGKIYDFLPSSALQKNVFGFDGESTYFFSSKYRTLQTAKKEFYTKLLKDFLFKFLNSAKEKLTTIADNYSFKLVKGYYGKCKRSVNDKTEIILNPILICFKEEFTIETILHEHVHLTHQNHGKLFKAALNKLSVLFLGEAQKSAVVFPSLVFSERL